MADPRKGTVHSSAEGHGGSVYCWGLPLRAQLLIVIYRKRPSQGWGLCTDAQGSCFQLTTGVRHGRNPLRALSGLLPSYIAIIDGPSAAALSGKQNYDFPQRKSAPNRYWRILQGTPPANLVQFRAVIAEKSTEMSQRCSLSDCLSGAKCKQTPRVTDDVMTWRPFDWSRLSTSWLPRHITRFTTTPCCGGGQEARTPSLF